MRHTVLPGLLGLLLPLVACLQIGTGTGLGTDGGPVATADAGRIEAGPSGAGCFQDTPSQTVLCEQIDTCPGLDVNQGVLPSCGFRMNTGGLDLECLCGDALCPIGVPTSCAQAAQLLDRQSSLTVCQQQGEGRCVQLTAPDAGGTSSTCDKNCQAQCAGDPSCMQMCGC
ncbi:MAG TPA: hypothetical protein VIF15_17750 [Polyangiaceae bacterium]